MSPGDPVAAAAARAAEPDSEREATVAERFGNERLMSGDQFESIAYGLALIGHSHDPDRWTAGGGLEEKVA